MINMLCMSLFSNSTTSACVYFFKALQPQLHPEEQIAWLARVRIWVKGATISGVRAQPMFPFSKKNFWGIDGSVGAIELKEINGNIEVTNNAGRVRISEPGGDLISKTNTGGVEVTSGRPLSGKYKLESNAGMVSLQLPKESNLVINAKSHLGKISVDGLPGKTDKTGPGDEFNYQMSSGKGQVNIQVDTGVIKIMLK